MFIYEAQFNYFEVLLMSPWSCSLQEKSGKGEIPAIHLSLETPNDVKFYIQRTLGK